MQLFKVATSNWQNMPNDIWLQIINNKLEGSLGLERLGSLLESGKKIKVKFGIDPTASNIHIGHTVPMMLVNAFVKKGHEVSVIIGDFTARIGDPSGRSTERSALTDEQIRENMNTYTNQIGMFVDLTKIRICLNSVWINQLTPANIFETLQMVSLSQATQREDFRNRIANGSAVSLAEVCYSILMGIDSVALNCDIEIGGIDQLLNFQQCREIMRHKNMEPEIALMTPILEGTSGDGRKMSKSYGNAIAVLESDDEKFGKFMSIKDELILPYFKCFAFLDNEALTLLEAFVKENPFEAKKQLATYFIGLQNNDMSVGEKSRENFERKFSNKDVCDDDCQIIHIIPGESMFTTLANAKVTESRSQLRQLFASRAIRTIDKNYVFEMDSEPLPCKIRIGKKKFVMLIE